jgi:chromosome partitioning protein
VPIFVSAVVVAFVNNKGGVGKTTSAVTIAAVLADQHGPVLLVDLDSQASASLSLGIARSALSPSVSQALLDGLPIARAIRTSGIKQLDLLTGSIDLASTDVALAEVANRERFLKSILSNVRGSYRHVLIDTPPSLSLLGVNALAAADAFVVPAIPQALALQGVAGLLESIDRLKRRLRLDLRFAGVLLTMLDHLARPAAVDISNQFRSQLRDQVFHTEIPYDAQVAEAPSFGRTVLGHAPTCAAADAYRRAAGELLQRLQPL